MQTKFFLLLSIFLTGCSPIAPEVRLFGTLPQGIDTPIYVTAARQKDEIIRALRDAGFHVAEQVGQQVQLRGYTVEAVSGVK